MASGPDAYHGKPIPPQYFSYPASYSGLSREETDGLRAVSAIAALSAISTFSVICFLIYRSIFWRKYYSAPTIYNQNIVLLFHLFVSDLFQAIGYSLSLHWLRVDGVFAPSPACTAQGIMINMGNVVSGSFVFLISIYTATCIFWGQIIPWKYLIPAIATCWVFGAFVSTLGLSIYGKEYFASAGIWCWARSSHVAARLWSHYIWIFLFEFCTLLIYITVFFNMRRRTVVFRSKNGDHSSSGNIGNNSATRMNRATWYMIVYPIVYLVCTAPLAIGRMYVMHTNKMNPPAFYIFAGCTITSAGSLDCLVYALTRRVFISDHNCARNGAPHTNRRTDNSQQLEELPQNRRNAAWGPSSTEFGAEAWKKQTPDLVMPGDAADKSSIGHSVGLVQGAPSMDFIMPLEESDSEQLISENISHVPKA